MFAPSQTWRNQALSRSCIFEIGGRGQFSVGVDAPSGLRRSSSHFSGLPGRYKDVLSEAHTPILQLSVKLLFHKVSLESFPIQLGPPVFDEMNRLFVFQFGHFQLSAS
jgi:hypothetical protein